jgi:hypothetical protein
MGCGVPVLVIAADLVLIALGIGLVGRWLASWESGLVDPRLRLLYLGIALLVILSIVGLTVGAVTVGALLAPLALVVELIRGRRDYACRDCGHKWTAKMPGRERGGDTAV